jgi:chromosome segregation ATPase
MSSSTESFKNTAEGVISFLEDSSKDVKEVVSNMSEKAKNIASGIYEGIYQNSVADRIVGRIEMSFNQFWVDTHQAKEEELQEKVAVKKGEVKDWNSKIRSIASSMTELSGLGQDTTSVQKRIEQFEKKKQAVMAKQAALETKVKVRIEKKEAYIGRRNEIADKLIDYYSERITPIEARIHDLNKNVDVLDFDVMADEIRNKERTAKLNEIKEAKEKLAERYLAAGMSSFKVHFDKTITQLGRNVRSGEHEVEKEQDKIQRHKIEIEKRKEKIQKVEEKTKPYEEKIDKLEAIKRKNVKRATIEADIGPKVDLVKREEKFSLYMEQVLSEYENRAEKEKLYSVGDLVSKWNNSLVERHKGKKSTRINNQISLDKFNDITEFTPDNKMTTEDFKRALLGYKKLMWRYRKKEIFDVE